MKRVENWENKFLRFIDKRMKLPMEWGKTDCFLFAVDCIQVITGIDCDHLQKDKKFRGRYQTSRGGYKILKNISGGGVSETFAMIAEELNLPILKNNNFSRRGDIALYNIKSEMGGIREVLGVVLGPFVLIQGKSGLLSFPISGATKIWSISKL